MIEVEDALGGLTVGAAARCVLVADFGVGSRGGERFDGPTVLLERLLDRHVPHKSTLRSLDLVE